MLLTMTKKSTKAPTKKTAAKAPAQDAAQTSRAAGNRNEGGSGKIAKTQLVDMVADKTGLTKKQSEEAVSAMLGVVVDAIKQGKSVGLPGLGTLSVKATAARTGVRPGTSERIQIPAGKKVAFKVASTLKSSLGAVDATAAAE
ncbi:MAG: HU family DNA-binding protein [Deinococcota bacterium]